MTPLTYARDRLLIPADLDEGALGAILAGALGGCADFADLYFQHARHESFSLEEGAVKSGSHSIARGFGARVVAGERTGFAYAEEIGGRAVREAVRNASAIAHHGTDATVPLAVAAIPAAAPLYTGDDPIAGLADGDKVALLEEVDRIARALDPRVDKVMATLAGSFEVVLVASSDGRMVADLRPLVRLNLSVVVEDQGRRESGSAGGGGRTTYACFRDLDHLTPEALAREAVRRALLNLEAQEAPAGAMDVVLGPGWPGVLLHEAIGHGLEGDFNRKGTSAFAGRLGERVAAPGCTVVDDGTLPDRRGSLTVDDEGTPTGRTVLIDDGILASYLQDQHNARLMGVAPTGNGRRQSFANLPLPRMTNTFMLPGERSPEEVIASVADGLYAVHFAGGQVDITSGKFVFVANEAYRIRGGRLAEPVKDATLIGNGPDCLTRVAMVGNDLRLDDGIGTCGKCGQSVPVGVGQPTLKITGLTVGGTR
jgi:TldD protein